MQSMLEKYLISWVSASTGLQPHALLCSRQPLRLGLQYERTDRLDEASTIWEKLCKGTPSSYSLIVGRVEFEA